MVLVVLWCVFAAYDWYSYFMSESGPLWKEVVTAEASFWTQSLQHHFQR